MNYNVVRNLLSAEVIFVQKVKIVQGEKEFLWKQELFNKLRMEFC